MDKNHLYDNCDPIAVIGMACRFPKAPNLESFWHNLTHGLSGQSFFSEAELEAGGISSDIYQREDFVPSGAVIDKPEYFDANLFGYSPAEAISIDPQQRIFLQNVWHALEHAGYAPTCTPSRTGVFGAVRNSTYPSFEAFDITQVGQVKGLQALIGNDKDYLATRVAHKFNFTGPAFTVQTACSSSLVATHLACESLRSGECDMAIAGGVAVSFPQKSGYAYQPEMIFSPDGLCRPFDHQANGTFGGHGVGSVVLKRLDDAIEAGDTVLAVLRGSAINNDGQDKVGFTAPSVNGQSQVLTEALNLADIHPDEVEMIEAHGTGTKLGDPIEFKAIRNAYQRSSNAPICKLGSVKSGLGHLDTAAGIASLIKTVLSVSRKAIPMSLNIRQPNPALLIEESGFELATQTLDWTNPVRTAAVSSFGIGGTNCHMIVQSLSAPISSLPDNNNENEHIPLLLSANSTQSLRQLAHDYAKHLKVNSKPQEQMNIANAAMQTRSLNLTHKLAVPILENATTALEAFASTGKAPLEILIGKHQSRSKLVWIFTGQGSQYEGMGKDWYHSSDTFKDSIELSQHYCEGKLQAPLTEIMFGPRCDLLTQTSNAQIAIVAFEIALAAHWKVKGITPDVVLGHSVGEISACAVAGYLSHQQAIQLVVERGNKMHQCTLHQDGAMLAIFAPIEKIAPLQSILKLDTAAQNGASHWVFSGDTYDVEQACSDLERANISYRQLGVSCAAHSRHLEPMIPSYAQFTAEITPLRGDIPLISCVTGDTINDPNELNADYWTRHVRESVQFKQAIEQALTLDCHTFMEVGPKPHLTSIGKREQWSQTTSWIHAEENNALCKLYTCGIDANWQHVFNVSGKRCSLPLYPFDEKRFWVESRTSSHISNQQDEPSYSLEPMTLRCAVIRDYLQTCAREEIFSLRKVIRGGRILPRHRHHIQALIDLLVTQGYYHRKDNLWLPSKALLPNAEAIVQHWLVEANSETLVSVQKTCQDLLKLGRALPDLLSQLGHISSLEKHLVLLLEGNVTSHSDSVVETSSTQLELYQNLSYQDWSLVSENTDLISAIHQQWLQHLPAHLNQGELSVSPTYQPKHLSRVAICRQPKMWGQESYDIRAQVPQGHWEWLARLTPKHADNKELITLLPSPHNRYVWQSYRVESDKNSVLNTIEEIKVSSETKGYIQKINQEKGILIISTNSLSASAEQLAKILCNAPDTLLILISGALKITQEDELNPTAVALMSIIRVARTEHPNKRFLVLDVQNLHAPDLNQLLSNAPFSNVEDLAFRHGQYWAQKLTHAVAHGDPIPASWFNEEGTHLVTGAMGGIGRLVIQWLASSGVKHITAIGHQQHSDWVEFCSQIAKLGCQITTYLVDLASDHELETFLANWDDSRPISGAIHTAGNVHHKLLESWDTQEAKRAFNVKAGTFSTLNQWLENQQGSYLIGFSSVASLGAPGQGLYAAANAYIDGFAQSNHANKHCRVMSLAWGAWHKIGMTKDSELVARLHDNGMHTLTREEGLWHLSQSLIMGNEHVFAMNISSNSKPFRKYFTSDLPIDTSSYEASGIETLDSMTWLSNRIHYQLALAGNSVIEQKQDLLQLGIDSLQFLELNAAIKKQFDIKLTAEEAYKNMTLEGLNLLIEEKSRQSHPKSTPPFIIQLKEQHNPFPLTPIQHAYWVGREAWVPYGGIACNVVFEWDSSHNQFSISKLESAWNAVVQRHDMLRMSVLVSGEQVILKDVPKYHFARQDLKALDEQMKSEALNQIRQTMSQYVRPAEKWPLFEIRISELTDTQYRIHMNLDLLQFDVQSFKIMMDDLSRAYHGHVLPPLALSFRDYVLHEQALQQQPEWQASWDYWMKLVPVLPKAPVLPLASQTSYRTPKFVTRKGQLPKSQWSALKTHWQQSGITPSAGLLTLFSRMLANWSESLAFTLNMTFFNRQPFHNDVKDLIGDFTSVLLMDFDWSQGLTLKGQMSQAQERLWSRLSHCNVNGVEVMREVAKHRKTSSTMIEHEKSLPMTPIVFTSMLGMSMDGMDIEKAMTHLLGEPVFVLSQTPQVWLDHQIMEVDGELKYHWYCMDGVLAPDIVDRMFEQYGQWLHEISLSPIEFERQAFTPTIESTSYTSILPQITPEVEKEVENAWQYLETQALTGLEATLRKHNLFVHPGQTFSYSQIIEILKTTPKHHKLVKLWLNHFVREGLLHFDGDTYECQNYEPIFPTSKLPQSIWCQHLSQYLDECIQSHSELLSGKKLALEILFKDQKTTDALYKTNPSLTILNKSTANLIAALAKEKGSSLNVLEVGAGTAATSSMVLDTASSYIGHYRFTDISQTFLNEAKQSLANYGQVSFGQLDINLNIGPQNKLAGGYDVVIAVNVLHDAINLPSTLINLRDILAKNGHLLLIEATVQHSPMQLATVGFIEGINAFNDFRQQADSAMLNINDWQNLLYEHGFDVLCRYPDTDTSVLRQHLILAQSNQYNPISMETQSDQTESLDNIENDYKQATSEPDSNRHIQEIANIWSSLLQQDVTPKTDFFLCGGDSLMATKLVVNLKHAGFDTVTLQNIFEYPVFADFCQNVVTINEQKSANELQKKQGYPLTPLQNAYWLGESTLFSLGQSIAHFYAELEIENLDSSRFINSWNELIRHHDQLRGEIQEGRYCIHQTVPDYNPHYIDLRKLSEAEKGDYLTKARHRIATQGVPTEQWPLFDIHILHIEEKSHLIHIVVDLVVADGKSLNLLFQQWQSLYQNPSQVLDTPAINITEYMEKAKLQNSNNIDADRKYWMDRLPALPDAPKLPLAESRSDVLNQGVLTHLLSESNWRKIQHYSFTNNVLPSMTMLAIFCLVLRRWSNNSHFSLNVLHSNRPASTPDSASLVGNLSTTSMLEVDMTKELELLTFIEQVQQQMSDDLAHSQFDGQEILTEKNKLNRNFSAGMPIVFNDTISVGKESHNTLGTLRNFGAQTPHVYLDAMLIASTCGGVNIKWTIQSDYLKPGVFDAMFQAYVDIVETLPSKNWAQPLHIQIPNEQIKRRQGINYIQYHDVEPRTPNTLISMVNEGVKAYPDRVAIKQGSLCITYQELWNASSELASQIQNQKDNAPLVAIVMDKGWQQVVAVLGIMLAGKAYLPIDASYPETRISALLKQGQVTTVISEQIRTYDRYRVLTPSLTGVVPSGFKPDPLLPSDLAYVIFTSGSTGQPKGVMMDHQAVINTLFDIEQRIELNSRDRVLAISALNFDLSVFDLFSTLHCGACLVIPKISPAQDPESLIHTAQKEHITIWNSVPAFAQLLADSLISSGKSLLSLRHVMMSGDWIPIALPDHLQVVAPKAKLLSLGGATEAAIWSIAYDIKGSYSQYNSIPYGKPLKNQMFFVLDRELNPCPDWVAGELYIGGLGLSLGYWQDKAKTSAAFIIHPVSRERLYKTGDLGRYQEDGNIEFLGRNDHQVKINGYRIELGEIETTLRLFLFEDNSRLQNVIVKPIKEEGVGVRLVAYIVCSQITSQDLTQLLAHARENLPAYMCPTQFISIDAIPLTPNGKIDRDALPVPEVTVSATARPPKSLMEKKIATIWEECLKQTSIPANQSFFDLGGNSLAAVRVISQINTALKRRLTVSYLQSHDTIEQLASSLDNHESAQDQKPILLNPENSAYPALFIVHPIGGHLLSYQFLAKGLEKIALYGLSYPHIDQHTPIFSVKKLAQHYVKQIKSIQPCGPFRLAGWSFGGVVVYEMAYQLRQQGIAVEDCILIDSYVPTPLNQDLTKDEVRHHFYADLIGRFPKLVDTESPNISSDNSLCHQLSDTFSRLEISQDMSADSIQQLLDVYRRNLSAMLSYKAPELLSVPVTLIKADQNNHLDFMSYQNPATAHCPNHGWEKLCDLETYTVSGDHYTLLQESHVNKLLHTLGTVLSPAPSNEKA
ncbi:non-ribosomal peptide synthetase/type I polyketide synthase [Vibrio hepatarius]|uniref:non-ribosomal peptide synthetase/type I polyketide synthase n=1 Tax=Vibrio hepatarius TaxID=171383 RepID=UPI001C09CDB2|nr:non-ribosomal peptide synthetase/type I polyketide synthase [Vibrio hepatarius]MBU2898684.1 amino acid adenylation domain-containing protein [Vibrio hepatarius]